MINVEEFRDLIKEIVRDELGDRTQYRIAEIASVGDKVSVIFSGETEPTQKEYTYLKSYHPVVGDRVWLAKDKGTYVVLGKIDGYDEPMSGQNENGHWIKLEDGTQICHMPSGLLIGDPDSTYFRGVWEFPSSFITAPSISYLIDYNGENWGDPSDAGKISSTGYRHDLSDGSKAEIRIRAKDDSSFSGGHAPINALIAIGKWK